MRAYEGSEKYIFVSYAHKDSAVVIPIIEALQARGFRIWYDSGIEAGTEWPAYIEEHLKQCTAVLAFISPACIASVNCRNEINLSCMLNKKILIAYLQKTELAHGMQLQLSSLQSIFRERHKSDSSFINELARSPILQCCHADSDERKDTIQTEGPALSPSDAAMDIETALLSGNLDLIKESRKNAPPMISKVGSIGATDIDNPWPLGKYSTVINIDKFNVVYFHAQLVRAIPKEEELAVGLLVFDSENALVYENITKIAFKKGYDRVSKSWIIRGSDGMPQSPGSYTALIWVGESRMFEYKFRLKSYEADSGEDEEEEEDPRLKELREMEKKELDTLTKKLEYPKIFRKSFFSLLFFFGMIGFTNLYSPVPVLVCLVLSIVFAVRAYKNVKASLIHNKLLALLAVTLGNIYLTIAMLVVVVLNAKHTKKWKERVQELKSKGIK